MSAPPGLNPAARTSLDLWHDMLLGADMRRLGDITSDAVVFRSPAFFKPYHGKSAFVFIISAVSQIFEDFRYHRQFASSDGMNAVLEFEARIGQRSLKGIDMIRFDEDGLIAEFEVMIRPANALAALAEKMSEKAGAGLAEYRAVTGR
ncbi:nuclear transport factor 2 family protein [Hoeflea prorocentri]|uniref:Nuclear transport factor 2 family protein n=1 Tax=Hoeflea prorocentri TaxID=1922333 RepID=A0A9X3UHV6_9HYPH|nr:nuclear transport factor 2 family protein [Hoeflea prorocentri]MCY6381143.1 nuclear transport factor 2 family protein [Hoeflea prorocentri]MDA5398943.1 nuclear transport factor 2 family protein [Hoeflea prorocentri]